MDYKEKENLRINRVEFVQNLEATDILDYLLEDGIITENDCELIASTKTRKERTQLLLAMLPTRGPYAYGSFRRALNLGQYQYLEDKLSINPTGCTDVPSVDTTVSSRHSEDLRRCMAIISNCKNEKLKAVFAKHVVLLLDNIEPIDIIDHFFQENLITDDGIEMVKTGKTRKERCFTLLYEISKYCSDVVIDVLCRSLSKKYNFITKEIKKSSDQIKDQVEPMTRSKVTAEYTHLKGPVSCNSTRDTTETHLESTFQTDLSSMTPLKEIQKQGPNHIYTERSSPALDLNSDENRECQNSITREKNEGEDVQSVQYDFDQTYGKGSSNPKVDVKMCSETNTKYVIEIGEQVRPVTGIQNNKSVACCIKNSEFTTQSFSNRTENTEDYVENSFPYTREQCEQEMHSNARSTFEIGNDIQHGYVNVIPPTHYSKDQMITKNVENRGEPTNHKRSDELFDTDQSILWSNEADGTPILHRERVQPHRPTLMSLTSTDSEPEKTMTKKMKKKTKIYKRKFDTGNRIGKNNCYCTVVLKNSSQSSTKTTLVDETCDKIIVKGNNKTADQSSTECKDLDKVEVREFSAANYQPGGSAVSLSGKHLVLTFNYLSTLINQGNYDKFELFSSNIQRKYCSDPDMQCLLGYLHASRDLYKTDFDSAKSHINKAFEIVPQTSNPKYFTLELFTTKTRMYITQKKLEKLQQALDDAKMIIETDPLGCTGRASGWLYMNDARNCTAQISLLNFRNPTAIAAYTNLHSRAKSSFQKALSNFDRDGGKDGPFGFGYALCRLAILLLQCGDNGLTMNVLVPSEDDVRVAGGYLQKLEDSEIAIPKILEMHFVLAKSDYQFRRRNTTRALQYAELALSIASDMNLLEFIEHARNRCIFLRKKHPIVIEDISEEEFKSALFGETDTQSE